MAASEARAALAAGLALARGGAARRQDCAPGVADLRDPDSSARFQVEVADTPSERARGLMFRESLPRFAGMLFVYETPQPVAFWMRNTLIPLDMLFFDAAGRLTRMHANARPLRRDADPGRRQRALRPGDQRRAGGRRSASSPGAELRHPAVDQARRPGPASRMSASGAGFSLPSGPGAR